MGLTGKGLRRQTRKGGRGLSEGAKEAGRPGVTALGGTALFSWGESAPPVGSFVTGLAPCNLRQTPRAPTVAGDRFRFRQLPSSTARWPSSGLRVPN